LFVLQVWRRLACHHVIVGENSGNAFCVCTGCPQRWSCHVFIVFANNRGHVMLLLSLTICSVGDSGGAHVMSCHVCVAGDNNCRKRVPLHVLAASQAGACAETPAVAQSGPFEHHR